MPCPLRRADDSASSRLAPVATTSPVSTETAAQLPGVIPPRRASAVSCLGASPGFGMVEGGSLVGNESASVLSNVFSVDVGSPRLESAVSQLSRIESPKTQLYAARAQGTYLTNTFMSPCFSTTSTRTVPACRSRKRSARPWSNRKFLIHNWGMPSGK